MSFRLRLTLLSAVAVAVALVGTSVAVYFTDRSDLINQIDSELSATRALPVLNTSGGIASSAGGGVSEPVPGSRQIVLPRSLKAVQIRVSAAPARSLPRGAVFASRTIDGIPSRVLSYATAGRSVEISTSMLEVDRNLRHLRFLLILISLAGTATAVLLGALVSRRAVAPLRRLTETTERIVETGDLSARTGRRGRDEISRLSIRLDELLSTLETSLSTQRQLVADASHELRTPLATLRANVELLAARPTLAEQELHEVEADVRGELESMTALVAELVELARGEELDAQRASFRLDEVVRVAVERAARRAPALHFATVLEPTLITGMPDRVERAVANLLDNACKWSPRGGVIDVSVTSGSVAVRDRGPGIASEDVPLVFNRFYRSAADRGMPGAGLGLAIVKQVAEAHGGSVSVECAEGGGALLRLVLEPRPGAVSPTR